MNIGRWYGNEIHEWIYIVDQKGFDRWDVIWFVENRMGFYISAMELDRWKWHDRAETESDLQHAVKACFVEKDVNG